MSVFEDIFSRVTFPPQKSFSFLMWQLVVVVVVVVVGIYREKMLGSQCIMVDFVKSLGFSRGPQSSSVPIFSSLNYHLFNLTKEEIFWEVKRFSAYYPSISNYTWNSASRAFGYRIPKAFYFAAPHQTVLQPLPHPCP